MLSGSLEADKMFQEGGHCATGSDQLIANGEREITICHDE